MAQNGISTLATKELRQIAKLDLAAAKRAIDSNARSLYDITQLPTRYSDNDVTDNLNTGGLIIGRPWYSGLASLVIPVVRYTLSNPNAYSTSAGDGFAYNVSMSASYALVGAYGEDDAGGAGSGKAYIFSTATGLLLHTLDNPNAYSTSAGDGFGGSTSISETYAIVGAATEKDAAGSFSGKAYIFDTVTGALLWTLDNPNPVGTSAFDTFASAVSISNSYAIAGAASEDQVGASGAGKAYIFNPATGVLLWTLNNPNAYGTAANDNFGGSVSISETHAIVGAFAEDDAGGNNSGKAYIFDAATGALVHTLDNPNAYDGSASDNFGSYVAISGNYAIVAAYAEKDAGGSSSGKAYIFDVITGALLWTLDNPNAYDGSAGDYFGISVAIQGTYAIVGAYGEDDINGGTSGKAYIFDVTTGALIKTLDNPNPRGTSVNDAFGESVAINGNYALVGAYGEDESGNADSGKAYIFKIV